MSKYDTRLSKEDKVHALYLKLAGDKLDKCNDFVEKLVLQGYKKERAMADALEVFKCVKNELIEEC